QPTPGKASNEAAAGNGPAAAVDPAAAQRKVVLTAELRIRVPDPDRATGDAQGVARLHGGLVSDERTSRAPDPSSAERYGSTATTVLTLKVPPAEFDKTLDELSRIGKVLNRQRAAKDVTDEVVDVNSRIESQRRSVERTRQLMDKATTISDIVTVESELTRREADLESLLKRQQSLTAQTDLSTITLTIDGEPGKAAPPKDKGEDDDSGFADSVGDAWSGGWHALYAAGSVVSVVCAAVFPFALILVLLWLANRFTGRPVNRLLATARHRGDSLPASGNPPHDRFPPTTPPPPPPATTPKENENRDDENRDED
ncbi:DUF4349 domain-containing protein, partial [Streptomyces sp. SID3343]|uniref:DUF4349 domain-containing protein n=1 Tax=Streptomyces sp. SID3343 TaxID=2690260 RepID=UPI00137102A8